jgi:hypothetical protein
LTVASVRWISQPLVSRGLVLPVKPSSSSGAETEFDLCEAHRLPLGRAGGKARPTLRQGRGLAVLVGGPVVDVLCRHGSLVHLPGHQHPAIRRRLTAKEVAAHTRASPEQEAAGRCWPVGTGKRIANENDRFPLKGVLFDAAADQRVRAEGPQGSYRLTTSPRSVPTAAVAVARVIAFRQLSTVIN